MTASNRSLLRQKVARFAEHRLASLEKEIMGERNRLQIEISKWQQEQLIHMEHIPNRVVGQEPERQVLYLPSDFPDAEHRRRLNIDHLATIETQLREGEAYDALRDVRMAVKHINGLTYKKQTSVRDAGPNTRAKTIIDDVKRRRDAYIARYSAARQAMINLGYTQIGDRDEFPELTVADAVMKYTERPHALGDGSKSTAMIWRAGGRKKVTLPNASGRLPIGICLTLLIVALLTASVEASDAASSRAITNDLQSPPKEDSWIWRIRPNGVMSDNEADAWSKAGKYLRYT